MRLRCQESFTSYQGAIFKHSSSITLLLYHSNEHQFPRDIISSYAPPLSQDIHVSLSPTSHLSPVPRIPLAPPPPPPPPSPSTMNPHLCLSHTEQMNFGGGGLCSVRHVLQTLWPHLGHRAPLLKTFPSLVSQQLH